jgi:hypothetical protein
MQLRRPRLGDILDDYCPRERRITSHAVVAMVEDEVMQTRCTACHADHDYKGAKVPPPRRKRPEAEASEPVESTLRPKPLPEAVEPPDDLAESDVSAAEAFDSSAAETENPDDVPAAVPDRVEDDGPVHRRLIRATLPRPDGQSPERRAPDFTIHQPGGRGGRREVDGNRAGQRSGRGRHHARQRGDSQPRFGGSRQGGDGSGQGRTGSGRGGQPGGPRGNRAGRGPNRGSRKRGR